jgi:hypothetical protein
MMPQELQRGNYVYFSNLLDLDSGAFANQACDLLGAEEGVRSEHGLAPVLS